MQKWLSKWWKSYKYRFVPWIAFNMKYRPQKTAEGLQSLISRDKKAIKSTSKEEQQISLSHSSNNVVPVHHVKKSEDKRISDSELIDLLTSFFSKCHYVCPTSKPNELEIISAKNQQIMKDHFGFCVQRMKSSVSEDAGTGVFVTSGTAKAGSVVALYPGTIYMPYEPLFFPSLGNPFIFRCSDGIHIDGNNKFLSKSIYKSCAARDKFNFDIPCCDTSWLTPFPLMPLNVGQYVNNRTHSLQNNVVYQECELTLKTNKSDEVQQYSSFPHSFFRYIPNVWCNGENNQTRLRLLPLLAIKDINEGEELLSSYFTVVHTTEEK